MTTANTRAATYTKIRIEFVLNHFRSALSRLTEFSKDEIDKILDAIRNEDIESLEFVGYTTENTKRVVYVQLKLCLDLDEHHKLSSNQPLITYASKFDDECSPEIYGFICLVQDQIKSKKLKTTTFFGYTKLVRESPQRLKAIRRKLGTSPTEISYDYSQLTQEERSISPEAPELSAECRL